MRPRGSAASQLHKEAPTAPSVLRGPTRVLSEGDKAGRARASSLKYMGSQDCRNKMIFPPGPNKL